MGQRWGNKENATKKYRKSFDCFVIKPISRLHLCRFQPRHKSRLCDTGIYFASFIKRRLTAVVEIATDFPSKNFVTRSRTLTLYWSPKWYNIIHCVALSHGVLLYLRYTECKYFTFCICAKYLKLTVYCIIDNIEIKRLITVVEERVIYVCPLCEEFKRIIFVELKLKRVICLSFYAWYHHATKGNGSR